MFKYYIISYFDWEIIKPSLILGHLELLEEILEEWAGEMEQVSIGQVSDEDLLWDFLIVDEGLMT